MLIRQLQPHEPLPMQLLLLADPSEELILSYIRHSHIFIAETGATVAGVMVLQQRGNSAELMNVAVAETMQGKGIGRNLVEHAKEWGRQQGIERLMVCTGNSSLPALALYKRCGFEIAGIERGYFLRHYPKPIFEYGMQCVDRVKLRLEL